LGRSGETYVKCRAPRLLWEAVTATSASAPVSVVVGGSSRYNNDKVSAPGVPPVPLRNV